MELNQFANPLPYAGYAWPLFATTGGPPAAPVEGFTSVYQGAAVSVSGEVWELSSV